MGMEESYCKTIEADSKFQIHAKSIHPNLSSPMWKLLGPIVIFAGMIKGTNCELHVFKKYYLLSFFAIEINQALVTFEKTKKLNGQPGSGKIKTELQPFPYFNVQCHAPFSLLQFVFKASHSKLNQWKHKEIS